MCPDVISDASCRGAARSEKKNAPDSHDVRSVFDQHVRVNQICAKSFQVLTICSYLNGDHCLSFWIRTLKRETTVVVVEKRSPEFFPACSHAILSLERLLKTYFFYYSSKSFGLYSGFCGIRSRRYLSNSSCELYVLSPGGYGKCDDDRNKRISSSTRARDVHSLT